jgi:hypothetical protein
MLRLIATMVLSRGCLLYITLGHIAESTTSNSSSVVSLLPCVCMCIPPFIAVQQLTKHVSTAMNTQATIEELLDMLCQRKVGN